MTASDKTSHGPTLLGYAVVIFLSSAGLLILEIVASRLLAPYVGVSLYTWTAIIGVILAGLSLGNWLGGAWADRGAGTRAAGWTLVASGLATLAIPALLVPLADLVQARSVSLLEASVVYVGALFFLPALVLGIITPLLTTLALSMSARPGHVVGTMHALAALGSICGTFAAGFWLVPTFGTRHIIVATGVGLALMGLVFLLRRPAPAAAAVLLTAAVAYGAWSSGGLNDPCTEESQYYCIRVIDEPSPWGASRTLVLDHMVHSINHRDDPEFMITPHAHAMDELLRFRFPDPDPASFRVFFAGGGAYTQPRALAARYPDAHIEVAEIDPEVTAVAREELYVDLDGITVHDVDARMQLPRAPAYFYDAVVTDVFHDVAVPYHLTTAEFAAIVRSRLTPGGLYVLNVVDLFPDSKLVKGIIKALQTEFEHVQVWLGEPPAEPVRLTYILTATNGPPFPPEIYSRYGLDRAWFDVTQPVKGVGTPMADIPLLTDDYAPVERLVSTLFWTVKGL